MSRVRVYVLNNIASMVLRPRLTEELQIHGGTGFYTYTNLVSESLTLSVLEFKFTCHDLVDCFGDKQ